MAVSIIVPAFNEADGIAEFNRRLRDVRGRLSETSEVVYVNDGSRDDTMAVLRALRERDPTITIVNLSRNFGKEIALTAGLDYSCSDAAIVIDADLQDPPELIPTLIAQWREEGPMLFSPTAAPVPGKLGEKDYSVWILPRSQFGQRTAGPRRHRRFPTGQPTSCRSSQATSRAPPLHAGSVCLDRVSPGRRAI